MDNLRNFTEFDEYVEEKAFDQLRNLIKNKLEINELKKRIDERVAYCINNNLIYEYEEKGTIAVFDTAFTIDDLGHERIWARVSLNTRYPKSAKQKWYGLHFCRETILRSRILKSVKLHIGDIVFENKEEIFRFLDEVAGRAISEVWDFTGSYGSDFKPRLPNSILKCYLENIYRKLYSEGKLKICKDAGYMYFNTGLLSRYFKQVLVMCEIEENESDPLFHTMYKNPVVCIEDDTRVLRYLASNELPEAPSFYNDPGELFFDASLRVDLPEETIMHIFNDRDKKDRVKRLPPNLSNKSIGELISLFNSAIEQSKKLAVRNYKLVAPQYWPETGEIQFLMPIYLTGDCGNTDNRKQLRPPDVALGLKLMSDLKEPAYRAVTILSLDMAYNNARLIAKPDGFWLDPSMITDDEEDYETVEPEEAQYTLPYSAAADEGLEQRRVVNCKVVKVTRTHIYVSVLPGGEEGSIYIGEFSDARVDNLPQIVVPGEVLKAVVLRRDPEYGLQLSVKRLHEETEFLQGPKSRPAWSEKAEYGLGDIVGKTVVCRVTRVTKTHIYVEIPQWSAKGSIYIGEYTDEKIDDLPSVVHVGDTLEALALKLDRKFGVQLSVKRLRS